MIFSKAKSEKKYKKNVAIFLLCVISFALFSFLKVEAARQMEGVAFITDKTGQMISGDYTVRFALYSQNRTTIDSYPSDADRDSRIWEETQTVTIKNGILKFNLGQNQELPILTNNENNQFYLGIRINQDSELIPRKRITSTLFAYNATNASLLDGKKIGTNSGDILSLNATGKIDLQNLPIGTGAGQLITGNDSRLNDSLTLSGAKYLTLSNQKLTANKIKLSTDTQGTLPVNQGGTGLTNTPENGKVLMGTGSGYAFGSILGAGNVDVATTNSNISISLKDTINVNSLDVNDRLYLADSSVPTTTANRLYSNSGNLYWGNTMLGGGGGTLPTGTTGQTLNYHTSLGWSASSVLYNDGTNIGIGTTSPGYKLEVTGTTRVSALSINGAYNLPTTSGTTTQYLRGDGTWSAPAGTNHNLFSSAHSDTASIAPAQGDVIYYNGTNWTALSAGTSGNFLRTNGANSNPTWQVATGTTYTRSGTLLQLAGSTFSVKEGLLTNGRICTYSTTSGLVCDTDSVSVGHSPLTINATNNGLALNGQELAIALASTSATGALSNTDWQTFNSKLSPALTSGNLFIGNASNIATGVAMSGDVTTTNAGVTSIGADKITESMLRESTNTPANGNILAYNSATNGFAWVPTVPGLSHNLFSSSHLDMASITPAQGDFIYYNGTQWTTLAAGTNGYLLRTNGSGANPTWQAATGTTYTASGNLLQLTGSAFSLKEGTLTDTRLCTYSTTSGLVCNTTSASVGHTPVTVNTTANGLSVDGSQVLTLVLSSTSTTGALSNTDWQTFNSKLSPALTSGNLFIGNASNIATSITMTGDIAITNGGVTSIGANKITESMLNESTTAPSNGNILSYNSATSGFAWVATAPGTAHNLFSASHSDLASITPVQGDVIYYNGTRWTALTAGTSGNFLRTNGAGNNPTWQAATGTTYAASGNLLQLSGTTFSLKEGTLTAGRICSYDGTNLVCNTDSTTVGHSPLTINATNNGLTLNGQELALALASTSTTGALSNTDWQTFNSKLSPALTSGNLFIGNASNIATSITMTGDIAITNGGVTSIGANKITESMLNESTTAPSNGNILSYNSATSGFAWVATAPGTAHNLFSASHSDLASITPAQGDVIYYNGTRWTALTAGTSGNFLRTNGAGANPTWQTATGTTYTAAASNLLQLAGTEFSIKQGTMTDTKLCVYSTASGLVCDTSTSSFGHNPATINTPANGLSVDGSQVLTLVLASTSTTGALSNTDWNTFNGKMTSSLTSGSLFIGNASNIAAGVAMTGDIAITNAGVTSIGGNKITESMLLESNTNPQNGNILTYNSATQGFTWVTTAPGSAHQLFSASHSDMASVTPAQGDVMYYNGTNWTVLTAGTSGTFLKTQGNGANPIWSTATGTAYTATNGLTLNSTAFELGGTLTRATDIALASNNLTLSGLGNIGIGTTTPSYRLDVRGTAAAGQINAEGGLCINGVCKTAWTDGGIGSSVWTISGNDIYSRPLAK